MTQARLSLTPYYTYKTFALLLLGSVWIAPSSLKGFAGYGVFTTRPLAKGEHIIGRPDGVAIPVETDWDRRAPLQKERRNWSHMWGNY